MSCLFIDLGRPQGPAGPKQVLLGDRHNLLDPSFVMFVRVSKFSSLFVFFPSRFVSTFGPPQVSEVLCIASVSYTHLTLPTTPYV